MIIFEGVTADYYDPGCRYLVDFLNVRVQNFVGMAGE